MARWLRSRFWVIYATAAALCVVLGAGAWRNLSEASALDLPPPLPDTPVPVQRTAAPRAKDGAELAARNMFCSTCEPGDPTPEPMPDAPAGPLPLELIATNVANNDAGSFATIRHTATEQLGAYSPGDPVLGLGQLELVRGDHVVLVDGAGRRSTLKLGAAPAEQETRRPPQRASAAASGADDPLADSVKQIDDTHFELDRGLITRAITDPRMLAGARVQPTKEGVRLFGIRSGSPLSTIGLRNGDRIVAANGKELTSPDKILEVYGALKEARNVELTVERGGSTVTLSYTMR